MLRVLEEESANRSRRMLTSQSVSETLPQVKNKAGWVGGGVSALIVCSFRYNVTLALQFCILLSFLICVLNKEMNC